MRYFTDEPRKDVPAPEGGSSSLASNLFSTYQVASIFHTTPADVVEWMQQGKLPFVRLPNGPIRVSEGGLRLFCKNRGVDPDDVLASARAEMFTPNGPQIQANAELPPVTHKPPHQTEDSDPSPAAEQKPQSPPRQAHRPEPREDFRPPIDLSNDLSALESLVKRPRPASLPPKPQTPQAPQPQAQQTDHEAPHAPDETPQAPEDRARTPQAPQAVAEADRADALADQVAEALLADAISRRATHVHIEPRWDEIDVRLRIDGVLQPMDNLTDRMPEGLGPRVVASLKSLAGLEEQDRRPASAQFNFAVEDHDVRCHLASLPTSAGQRLLLELTDCSITPPSLSELGLAREDEVQVRRMMSQRSGLILVAGQPGSGRKTMLNAMVLELTRPERSVITIENAPNPALENLNQTTLTTEMDISCADVIAACCMQDPDVIMVQDLPDAQAVRSALEATQQGKLVLAGLQAESAPDAVSALLEMGIDPWSLSRNLLGVITPQTVRKLCRQCRRIIVAPDELLESMGLARGDLNFPVFGPEGCPACNHSGYRGKTGLFAILENDAAVTAAIRAGADAATIERAALQAGMRSLGEAAMRKVADAVTSIQEVARVMPHELFVRSEI